MAADVAVPRRRAKGQLRRGKVRRDRGRGERRGTARLALTIALRTSIRSIGRSALIVVMIALPVIALTGVAVVFASSTPTVQDRIVTELGETEARLQIPQPGARITQHPSNPSMFSTYFDEEAVPEVELAEVLPPGTRILEQLTTTVTASTESGLASFDAIEGPSWDESFTGRFSIAEGRAPRSADEVMVTPATLPRLGIQIGDTVELGATDPAPATVVGTLDAHIWPQAEQRFFGMEGAFDQQSAEMSRWNVTYYLPDHELTWDAVTELNQHGITALSRSVLLDPPPAPKGFPGYDNGMGGYLAIGAILAAFAAFEVVLLAGAAFTVTARQQQRSLATISSVGATRGVLIRILTANGLVLGGIGGLLGIALGIAGAALFMAVTDDGSSTQYYGFYLQPLWLLAIVVFAVFIGWVASLMPAHSAARFNVVAALRGARKPPPPSKRRPVFGLVLLIVGIVLAGGGGPLMAALIEAGRGMSYGHPWLWLPITMLIVGPLLTQVGVILCGPLLLRLVARPLTRAGIGARLASRDAARNPSRAVPALAAIMTTVFVAVLAMCLLSAGQRGAIENHRYGTAVGQVAVNLTYNDYESLASHEYAHVDAAEAALRSALDVAELRTLSSVPDPAYYGPEAGSADKPEAPVAIPVVPRDNLCPQMMSSPEFSDNANLPGTEEYRAARADWRCQYGFTAGSTPTGAHLLVGDADDLALVLDREPSAEARRMLEAGGAVSLYPHYVADGEFQVTWFSTAEDASNYQWQELGTVPSLRTETLDAVVDLPEHPIYFGVFISPATADRLELDYRESIVLADLTAMPTTEEEDALWQAMHTLPDNEDRFVYAALEKGPEEFAAVWIWGLVGLAGLIAIAASAVAIGLARFDGRQDDATLASLGANRLLRRNFAFAQGLIIAGFGAVLGAGLGIVPAVALSANPDIPLDVPWFHIGIVVAVLPMIIAIGSWLLFFNRPVAARRMSIT